MNATEYRKHPGTRRRVSVADFRRMAEAGIFRESERVELIDGEMVEMPPIGPAHADAVNIIVKALGRALSGGSDSGGSQLLTVQNPVQLDDCTEVYPDVAIVRDRRYSEAHPTPEDVFAVIEVSDSTLAFDRDVKIPAYAAAGIPEAWIINLPERCAEVHREPNRRDRRYTSRHVVRSGRVSLHAQPGIGLELDDLLPVSNA